MRSQGWLIGFGNCCSYNFVGAIHESPFYFVFAYITDTIFENRFVFPQFQSDPAYMGAGDS